VSQVPRWATLLEREAQLARIADALAAARAGRGALVVVEGPPGIGKTALLSAARAEAGAQGMPVLRARGAELEREFAFGIVRQLFEPVLSGASAEARASLLHGAAGAAETLFLGGAAPATLEVNPLFGILHGLYWLTANLAVTSPLCILVDDANWADAPSLRYLAFLITRLEELPVAVLVTMRPGDAGSNASVLAGVTGDPSADVMRLPPLTIDGVRTLVESTLGAPADPAFVEACARATLGTPFMLQALLSAVADAGLTPSAEAVREVERIGARSVARSIGLRLARLPESAGRLARSLSVLGEADVLLAARLAGLDQDEAVEAAELLTRSGVLRAGRPLAFEHAIVRDGIYEQLGDAERARAHGRAARLLADQAVTRDRVAEHLLASAPAADPWVVDRLVDAARAARGRGAPELEAIHLRRALVEPPEPGRLSYLLFDLGVAEASAGLDGWVDHLQGAVELSTGPVEASRPARALARALNRAQRFAEAVEVLDRAASALGVEATPLRLKLEAAAIVVGLNGAEVSPEMRRRRAALRAQAEDDPDAPPDILAAAAFVSVLANEPATTGAKLALLAEARFARASEVDEALSYADFFSRTALSLFWTEQDAELVRLLDASIARARAVGDSGLLAVGLLIRGWFALRKGDLGAAEADARTALAATELPAPPMYRVLNAAALAMALVQQGELEPAELLLAPLPIESATGIVAAYIRFTRAASRAAQGQTAGELDDLLFVGAALDRVGVTCPAFLPWRSRAAFAQLALGEHDEALRLAGEELELARSFGTPRALGVAERAAGVVVGGDRGELLLRASVASLERGGAVVERARALADLGALLRRANRRSEAREILREALDDAVRLGARPLAERAEIELRATGARPRRIVLSGIESLTASERRIAEYAVRGLTNREIAQTLFITTRTVEGHLTSVFRKLRLESRTELAGALGDRAPVSV